MASKVMCNHELGAKPPTKSSLDLPYSSALFINACTPKVGSNAWCTKQARISRGNWITNQATKYAKYGLLK